MALEHVLTHFGFDESLGLGQIRRDEDTIKPVGYFSKR